MAEITRVHSSKYTYFSCPHGRISRRYYIYQPIISAAVNAKTGPASTLAAVYSMLGTSSEQ